MHRASAVAFESPPQTGHLLLKVRKKQNSALKVSFASFLRAWRYTTPCRTRSIVQISPTTRKAGVVETAGQTPFIRQLRYWRGPPVIRKCLGTNERLRYHLNRLI